jgi:hypothetical protein
MRPRTARTDAPDIAGIYITNDGVLMLATTA